mgnify:CR=1 FL=1
MRSVRAARESGPGSSGTLSAGVTQVKSPTGMVWVLGRIYSDGAKADYAEVHALQDAFDVRSLSAWGNGAYKPANGNVDPPIDMKTAPTRPRLEPARGRDLPDLPGGREQ